MNKRIRQYVFEEDMKEYSDHLKNMFKIMDLDKEFKSRKAWMLLKNSFFKPVSGTESANAICD